MITCASCIAVGVAGLAVGFALSPLDAWLWLIVDFLIFSGIVNGMVIWAVAFRIAQARWTPAINRLSHAGIAFVPVVAAAMLALVAGAANYMPWVTRSYGKEAWLNLPGLIIREIVGLGGLWILCFLLVRWTLKADALVRRGESIPDRVHYRLNSISLAAAMTYSVVSTIVAWDFVMSLSPRWITTVFGAYYFTTNMYIGMAAIVLLAAIFRTRLGVEEYLRPQQFKDMGNLMLGFALLDMGLFYAQYLTIWYENLPDESFFLIVRYLNGAWPAIGWASFIIAYGAPFVLLQSRYIKLRPPLLSAVAGLAILGYALERYILVIPSFYLQKLMLFPASVLGILAFGGAFVLLVTAFLSKYPPVSTADAALRQIEAEEAAKPLEINK